MLKFDTIELHYAKFRIQYLLKFDILKTLIKAYHSFC